MNLQDDITTLKGVGEKTAPNFRKLGLNTVKDVIEYYPRTYKTYEAPIPVNQVPEGYRVAVMCKVVSYVDVRRGRRASITSMTAGDDTGSIRMMWFNQPYLRNAFHKGETYVFVGTIKIKGSMRIMDVPEYFTPFNYQKLLKSMQPVYGLTAGITNNAIKKAVEQCKGLYEDVAGLFAG